MLKLYICYMACHNILNVVFHVLHINCMKKHLLSQAPKSW